MVTPWDTIYASFANTLRAYGDLTAIVKPRNMLRWDVDKIPLIDNRQAKDLPALELLLVGGAPQSLHMDSSSVQMDMALALLFATNREELASDKGLFAVHWLVLKALLQAGTHLNNDYIVGWEITNWGPREPFDVSSKEKGWEQGWHSSLGIDVQTEVPKLEMLSR